MKTLDEVIKAHEICMSYPDDENDYCKGCPYAEDGEPKCYGADKEDALHYLKEYKAELDTTAALPDYYELVNFWAEQQAINPLTWQELKQMEGKPVWVEDEDCYSRWKIINGVYDDGISFGDYFLNKNEFGTVWQAYRKERE